MPAEIQRNFSGNRAEIQQKSSGNSPGNSRHGKAERKSSKRPSENPRHGAHLRRHADVVVIVGESFLHAEDIRRRIVVLKERPDLRTKSHPNMSRNKTKRCARARRMRHRVAAVRRKTRRVLEICTPGSKLRFKCENEMRKGQTKRRAGRVRAHHEGL